MNWYKSYFILFQLFCFFGYISAVAQENILDQYIQKALSQNLEIESANLKRTQQLSQIGAAKKLWGPSVDLNANYLLATGGRTLDFPIGDLFNPVYGTLNQITNSEQFPTDLENQSIQLTPNNFIDFQVNVTMPLINSSIRYNQKLQEELLLIKDLDIDLQKETIKYKVKTAYYNYLKSLEGLRVLKESQGLLEEVLVFNQKLVKFDKATDEIIFDVEYQIEKLNSQKAVLEEQNTLAKSLFNLLLQRDLAEAIEVDDQLVASINYELPSLETLKTTASKNRLEFQQLNISERLNQLNQERIQKESLPTVGVIGTVGIQTEDFNFDNGGPLLSAGLGMQWNLFDNGQRKKRIEVLQVDRNLIANNRAQLEQGISMEVIQSYYALLSLQSKMKAETAAEISASKSYERFNARYKNDKALLIELLQAQNRKTTSELSKVLTQYDFLIQQAALDKVIAQ